VKPPTRVPKATTVTWRMFVPPSLPCATTVILLPPRSSGTMTSKAPFTGVAVWTLAPTPTTTF
jgi:hypothetical protein